MPVSARVKKLISMEMCRCRLKRVKRRNSGLCPAWPAPCAPSTRRAISHSRTSQAKVCSRAKVSVPTSRTVMNQNDQNSQGYWSGSWCVAWVR